MLYMTLIGIRFQTVIRDSMPISFYDGQIPKNINQKHFVDLHLEIDMYIY